jgi:hypothetical protein
MKKSELKQIIKEEIRNVLAEATWTKQKIERELKDLQIGANEEGELEGSMAYDIAVSWLDSNKGLEDAIRKIYHVSDPIGFVADRIA